MKCCQRRGILSFILKMKMKFNFSESQKTLLVSALLAVLIAVAALAGYGVQLTPAPTQEVEFGAQAVSGPRLLNARLQGNTSADALTVTGALGANSGTFSTPLAAGQYVAPTAQPTYAYTAPTVVPTATPEILYGATPAAVKEVCKQVSVIGAATVTFAGISTPQAVTYGVAADPGGNVDMVSHTNSAGVVTVKTWIVLAGTPAAATTAVPIDVCTKGN